MGTRADFYIGIGPTAEWIGSTAWDGYPDGAPKAVVRATTEKKFRMRVQALVNDGGIATSVGWPWPWNDSRGTDYAYAWNGKVLVSCFGTVWGTLTADYTKVEAIEAGRHPIDLRDDEVVDMRARSSDLETQIAVISGAIFYVHPTAVRILEKRGIKL